MKKRIPLINNSDNLNEIKKLANRETNFISHATSQPKLFARIQTSSKISELPSKFQILSQETHLKQKFLTEYAYPATVIQQNLSPPRNLNLPKSITIDWVCRPCGLIGGDACSVTRIQNTQFITSYVLDVSGHGTSSAMVTNSITQYLQQWHILNIPSSPKQTLTELNQQYTYEKFKMLSTIFYMVIDTQNGKLIYGNAGHPPGVYLSPHQSLKLLNPTGPMIGVDLNSSFDEEEEILQPGSKIILYSDGITEYRNNKGEFYGSERLLTLLEQNKLKPVNEIIQILKQSMRDFGKEAVPLDDISVLGVEFNLEKAVIHKQSQK